MNGYVLDGCTLLNLYCGWGGITNLRSFPVAFHLGTVVAAEIHYVREYDSHGSIISKRLSTKDLARQYPLQQLVPTVGELDLTVRLSRVLDDGEAQALAIAISRSMHFCSDDGAVRKTVAREGLVATIVSTAELLQSWVGQDARRSSELPAIVSRITELGKFMPHRSSPDYRWWQDQLTK